MVKTTSVKRILVKPAKAAKKLVALYANEGCNSGNCSCSANSRC